MADEKPTGWPEAAATEVKHCRGCERYGHEAPPQGLSDLPGWPMASARMDGPCPLCPHDMGSK